MLEKIDVVSAPVTIGSLEEQISCIGMWAEGRESRFMCVANVHMVMEANWDPCFRSVLSDADLVASDGMPLVWVMRALGVRNQERLAGLDIFTGVCRLAEASGVSIYLLGSTNEVLAAISDRLETAYPNLSIAGLESPPFRPLNDEEDEAMVRRINESGAGILFVAFGCPKQEKWMQQHRGKVNAAMIGVGGAFPVYAGLQKRAPAFIRNAGLEWLFRLLQEPRRLWRRYYATNLPFIGLAIRQVLREKFQQSTNA